ncbi:MAG: hypothetical protein FJ138_16550, partial [Deltaproteobacteria bacterium]|nr:hypothetical protein [Deltaproteobacteria bacterium]
MEQPTAPAPRPPAAPPPSPPRRFTRPHALAEARAEGVEWDILIIGGGATGLGAAVDAASR